MMEEFIERTVDDATYVVLAAQAQREVELIHQMIDMGYPDEDIAVIFDTYPAAIKRLHRRDVASCEFYKVVQYGPRILEY